MSTMLADLGFDEVYELEEGELGSLIGYDLHGRQGLDVIEAFLAQMEYEYAPDAPYGGWEAEECWRTTDPETLAYHYRDTPVEGGVLVTRLSHAHIWGYWCLNHRDEPASSGVPVSQVVDGEQIVAEESAALAGQVDPRPTVTADRLGMGAYIYLCRTCSTSFHDRLKQARAEALREGS